MRMAANMSAVRTWPLREYLLPFTTIIAFQNCCIQEISCLNNAITAIFLV